MASRTLVAARALRFVREHGIVLRSARGPLPNLAQFIAGGPIRGSWWAHPAARTIFHASGAVSDSRDVLTCRLFRGKVTLVHRRLWPALVRLAPRLPRRGLASIREEHTSRGAHRIVEVRFPSWVPRDVLARSKALQLREARAALGPDLVRLLAEPE